MQNIANWVYNNFWAGFKIIFFGGLFLIVIFNFLSFVIAEVKSTIKVIRKK